MALNNYGYGFFHQQQQPQQLNASFTHHQRFVAIDNLLEKLAQEKIIIGSTELLKAVDNDSFFNLWTDLWRDNLEISKQNDFLELVVAVTSYRHPQIYYSTQNFIAKVLQSGLIQKIVFQLLIRDARKQAELFAKIVHNLIQILIDGFELAPTFMGEDNIMICVYNVLTNMKNANFLSIETKILLDRLNNHYTEFQKMLDTPNENIQATSQQPHFQKLAITVSEEKPKNNFRELPIIPLPEELASDYKPFIRSAIVKGCYPSDNDYLDVQFRLMKEDLVHKFREGIAIHETDNSDIYVYRDVKLDPPTLHYHSGDYIHYANIKISKRTLNNKTMKYKSLLCLSSDNFKKDFLFAIIIDRDEKHLKEGKIGIKFEGNKFEVNIKEEYCMVESSAFFEAYRHVLTTLQSFKSDKPIPFSKYLVQLNTNIEKPAYLKNVNYFDFSPILTENSKTKLISTKFHPSALLNLNCEYFGMNESQFEAFKFALSSELAVIQGPPGTGKSYIGSMIAKFLLNKINWTVWNPDKNDERPMLVVCYTNHALDQFLTHIAGYVNGEDIVRVGSRCKSPLIQQFMLHNKRCEMSEAKISYNDLQNKINPLLHSISKNLEFLIQLETRLASNEALCLSENYGRFANNILFSKFFNDDDDIVKWLITHKRSETEYPFDVALIRQLVEWNVSEINAKNIYADACKKQREIEVAKLYRELNSSKYKNLPSHLNDENSKYWPKLKDIDELIQLGYPETLAIEILASVKNNIEGIRAEHIFMNAEFEKSDLVEIYKAKLKLIQDFLNPKHVKKDLEQTDEINENNDEENNENYGEWQIPENLEPYIHIILQAPPMTDNEAYNEWDLWKLSLLSRWRLYQFWISEAQKARKREIADLEGKYRHYKKLLDEQKTIVDCEVMKKAKIIGMTTTGAAKYQSTLRTIKPRIVIAEEAAEVFEAHIVTSLTEACEHLILIGDHKQLRPNPAVYDLVKKCHLDISLFERLIKNNFPYKMLNYQRRMRPEISMLMKNHFYEDLRDHENVMNYPHVRGVTKDLFFINHSNPETTNKQDGSHKNEYEINYALKLAKYFLQQGYKENQIVILCPYSDQCLAIQKEEKKILGEDSNGIRIETVDNYQGEESDIVILSLVRSNNYDGKIGFLKVSNRKCVALSRAKIGLYIIGNMNFIASAEKSKYDHIKKQRHSWEKIINSAKANKNISDAFIVKCQMHGKIQEIKTHKDFDTKCIEGGCELKCEKDLKCGHKCVRYCHGDDMDHIKTVCHQPCQKQCPLKHECKKECWEECGPCEVEVKKTLDCGHEEIVQCYIEKIDCKKPCDRFLACDHECPKMCFEECPTFCEVPVTVKLGCGKHRGQKKCSEDPLTVKCMEPVKKHWTSCGHTANTFCYVNPEIEPCPHPCDAILQDCRHKCQGTCGSCIRGLLHEPCGLDCNKQLFCGHKCQAKCYEACPPCERYCRTACGHTCCSAATVKGKKQGKVRFLKNEEENGNGRKCCKACPPCMEDCLIVCNHSRQKCTMKCGQDCNIELCTKPCGKPLPCSKKSKGKILELHPCVGICGETKCLSLCPICNFNELTKIVKNFPLNKNGDLFSKGNNAFIQLDDCKHVFEVKAFDDYIKKCVTYSDHKTTEITKLKCPKCDKPIFTSHRYNNYINKQAAEIENIKQILREFSDDKDKKQKFEDEAVEIVEELSEISFVDPGHLTVFKDALNMEASKVTPIWLLAAENCKRILSTLAFYASIVDEMNFTLLTNGCKIVLEECQIFKCRELFKHKFNAIFDRCSCIPISNELFEQLLSETKRFGFLVDLFRYLIQFSTNDSGEIINHDNLKAVIKSLISNDKFSDDHEAWELFEFLKDQYTLNYQSIMTTRIILENVPQNNKWFKEGEFYRCT